MELNCSRSGDRRFHPAYAEIEIHGYRNTIQNIVAQSKRILKDGVVTSELTHDEAKHYPTVGFVWEGLLLPYSLFKQFVGLLWYKYLHENPELVSELEDYARYNDHGQIDEVSHAEFISYYMMRKENSNPLVLTTPLYGEALLDYIKPLLDVLGRRENIIIETHLMFDEAITEVVGQFQQLETVVETPPTFLARTFNDKVYKEYFKALGKTPNQVIGGCFVKYNPKTNQRVALLGVLDDDDYFSFRQSLESLKVFCMQRGYSISLHYDLGTEIDSSEWKNRYAILNEVFDDYYIILYKQA